MNRFFDINELEDHEDKDEIPVKSGILAERYLDIHQEKITGIKELSGRIPEEGEVFFLWTVNSFNAFTFIPFIIHQCGVIDELLLATYSINIRIIDALIRLIDKEKVLSVDIVISDSIRSRLPKVYEYLTSVCENKPIRVRYAWTHAKISLIRCNQDHFVVEGSGNWGENAQHEQYVFLRSRKVFEFRKNEIIHGINASAI
ncbi:MAG TPA: hypothetical protein PKN44_13085 [Bacteroidales bacterium]|nr:hypothetical protein [Bacteroidales bacterium]HPS51718.1 hypothetical protein [Bacteroidales bacterium]